ncbi:MAG: hypothetical protein CVU42_13925 [Chloroflexi bacterium HGW-Chloroflexi-4]|jgi:GH25 family lysozyme M1 (1,4-beta-N-acetylmuramidase)|nr:MAG: hypothetical protein CVU42_13925 [Chloroflexi bacterium HGW-Chloroflexi-4]
MGLKYSSFAIRGTDISQFNGLIDWSKFTSVTHHICGIRMGFGIVADEQAEANWKAAKYKCNRMPYWYMDYYSNHMAGSAVNGLSDTEWGRRQAEKAWAMLKGDMEGIMWLDIENGNPRYADPLSKVRSRALAIAKAFLIRWKELSGKNAGIYCSLGLLSWFDAWFKTFQLWCAWYNESQTIENVRKAVKAEGWVGELLIWQYASHGAINGDGVQQGLNLGTEIKELDLNAWCGSISLYSQLWGGAPVVVTPEDETPVEDEPIDITDEFVSYVIDTGKLNIRALPTTNSKIVGSYLTGYQVNVEKSVDLGIGSVSGWKRIHDQQGYLAMDFLKLKG